ncbi:hypothetical protein BpHYR1_036275 [Brachionus plicatilis]|uniref:Uncharacterized protein n=1 Tax=Brachionus plicatilis TaxID=10195 RepID=A0A3M7QKS6_BRAPC|nr:hypothetical protein BpHYR1_036275 [Brachionus plicatilis]
MIDEDAGHKKKASNYYFFRLVIDKDLISRDFIFNNLKAFDIKKNVVRPFRLVVDIQTQCDYYLKEINVNGEIIFNDQVMVFMEFLELKFKFGFEWIACNRWSSTLKQRFKDRQMKFLGVSFSDFDEEIGTWLWAQQYEKFGAPAIDDIHFSSKSKEKRKNMLDTIKRLRDLKKKQPKYRLLRPLIVKKKFDDWRDSVIEWWNEWTQNPYSPKRPQLYLFGKSDSGKTSFIVALLSVYSHQIFMPDKGKYEWQDWNPYQYTHVIIDEMNLQEYNKNTWKQVVAGEAFQTSVKHKESERKLVQCPMIFISNHLPEPFPGMETRLKIVECDEKSVFISDINEYLTWDFSIKEEDLPLQPDRMEIHPFDYVRWETEPKSHLEKFSDSGFLPETPATSRDFDKMSTNSVLTVPKTPRRTLDIDERSESSSFSSCSAVSKRTISEEIVNELFDLSNVESTPVHKRKKISRALFTLAKKWQVKTSELTDSDEHDNEVDGEIFNILTDLIDDVQENQ